MESLYLQRAHGACSIKTTPSRKLTANGGFFRITYSAATQALLSFSDALGNQFNASLPPLYTYNIFKA